jgi:putative intracellular protease/amidase
MADMMDKTVLFLSVSSLSGTEFEKLWQCFGNLNASTRIAGATADEEIRSKEGRIDTRTDMSFADATEQDFDVVVIADGVTARFIKDNTAANTLIAKTFENNAALVAVDDGVLALADADVIRGLRVTAPDGIEDQIVKAGAVRVTEPICISNNLFTALEGADMQLLCNSVAEYITSLGGAVAA